MPSDTNHIITNFGIAIIMFSFYQRNPFLTESELIFASVGYFIGTILLSPDIDTRSKPSQRCGLLCKPLTIISTHRGKQHHWLYGAGIRIIYLITILSFIIAIVYGVPSVTIFINILIQYKSEMISFIGGIFVSNLFHIILDNIF